MTNRQDDSGALRELAAKWREGADALEAPAYVGIAHLSRAECYRSCADQLDALSPQGSEPAGVGEPVAWSLDGFIYDEDGRAIGTDETQIHWGADKPDSDAGWQPLYATPAPAQPDGESALWALRQILHDLPDSRDWMDPAVERVARDLVLRNRYADHTTAQGRYCEACEQVVTEPCQSVDCATPEPHSAQGASDA